MLPEQWIFGGICRETREVFMVAVPNRTADVLLGVIREKIRAGSTIMLDCWSAYIMVYEYNIEMFFIDRRRWHIQSFAGQPQQKFC